MDGDFDKARENYERLLKETARASVEMEMARTGRTGIPHYSEIEMAAHRIGRELSCRIQQQRIGELIASLEREAPCPECGKICSLKSTKRTLASIDGPVEAEELEGHCDRCRRSFFPSADPNGLGQPRVDTRPGRTHRVRGS